MQQMVTPKVQRLDIVANSSSLKAGSEGCASFINAKASLAAKTKPVSLTLYPKLSFIQRVGSSYFKKKSRALF